MKKTVLIILLIIPALSVGIFWYQKKSHSDLYELIKNCKEAHMSCLTEKESIIEPAQELINDDLNEYLNLKTLKEKYLKADELMAKAFQTFLIIQGIRLSNSQQEWAYKNDQQRSEELIKAWEDEVIAKGEKIPSPLTMTSTDSLSVAIDPPSSSASENKIASQALPRLPRPLRSFWKKYFRINKSNSTLVNQNKLLLLEGNFTGTFIDTSDNKGAFFFQLSFPQKSQEKNNPENQVMVHMEGMESAPSTNQLLYLEENFKIYQVTQGPMSDFYVLKSHTKNIEVHLNIMLDKKSWERSISPTVSQLKKRKLVNWEIFLLV